MATKAEVRLTSENRFKAMAHPLRAKLLLILNERVASPKEMAEELGKDTPTVSYHAKRLVKLQCAELVEQRPVRGAVEHFYRATERHLVDLGEWEDLPTLIKEMRVGEFMQKQIDDFVASVKAGMIGSDERFHLTRTPNVMDQQGFDEALEIQEEARLKIEGVRLRSEERLAESGEKGIHVSSSHGCFEMPAP
jgi:DNA-binding transcriptional ArsR family regulator